VPGRLIRLASRSVTGKFLVLALMFMIVPVILFSRFQAADAERQGFLLRSLQSQGRLASAALAPRLGQVSGIGLLEVQQMLAPLGGDGLRIKLLLRPQSHPDSFLMMASQPPIAADKAAEERDLLVRAGLLDGLAESCAGGQALAQHFSGAEGEDEVLTSITPLDTAAGCWVIVTAYMPQSDKETGLLRPFAAAPEVRLASSLYIMIAFLALLAVLGALFDLKAFTRLAVRIRQRHGDKGSFAEVAQIPELLPIAREFDRMVAALDAAAQTLRDTAADTAHSLKTPIAAITQSLEPLRPLVAASGAAEPRGKRAIESIESALARLADLVEATRHLETSRAELMLARLCPIDIAKLARGMAQAYDKIHGPAIPVTYSGPASARVAGTEDSLETILENLLDNAIDFTPAGKSVRVAVAVDHGRVRLTVDDDGPGVPPELFDQIFRRDFSRRPPSHQAAQGKAHFGLGLAIVQRSVEILGGAITPENRSGGGLRMTVTLPLAD
jgi:two-component system sensor histidine kinase ChvG